MEARTFSTHSNQHRPKNKYMNTEYSFLEEQGLYLMKERDIPRFMEVAVDSTEVCPIR